MADDCDRADERIINVVADALADARMKSSLLAVGFCHYCGEACNAVFCDAECRDDYDYEQARLKANGR